MEEWAPHPSAPILDDPAEHSPRTLSPTTGHVVSCFNESAKLCKSVMAMRKFVPAEPATLAILLSMIIQIMYPIRRHVFRLTEFSRLEKLLDKWYLELPEHLRFDPASSKHDPLTPHVLTLHLQYWCTVILLHRPL